jgi:hypothetical protein
MAIDTSVKQIPEALHEMIRRSAAANFRSFNQEVLYRLQASFDQELKSVTRLHQQWLDEGLQSGPARPFDRAKFKAAVRRGLEKAAQ